MPTIVGILTFMSGINFMLSCKAYMYDIFCYSLMDSVSVNQEEVVVPVVIVKTCSGVILLTSVTVSVTSHRISLTKFLSIKL